MWLRSAALGAALLAALPPARAAEPKAPRVTVTDGVGRSLQVPARIGRVYVTSPVAVMMLYTLAPEKMVGWNYPLAEAEKRYILPAVRDLPALGGWFGESGKGNRETLLASRPDLILSLGNTDRTAIDFAVRLEQQVGVPVYVDSGQLRDTARTYRQLGKLLQVEARAEKLAAYAERALAETRAFVEALPPGSAPSVYYAEGLRGLQTDTQGSVHTEPLDYLGIPNVATGPATSGFGRITVSLDQVIAWRPAVILACPEKRVPNGSWVPEWLGDSAWASVPAVAQGRVYLIPGAPFNWFDRPPSAARLLGLKWLLWILWPDRVRFDMVAEAREFYRLFYQYEMGEAEARELLSATRPQLAPRQP